MSLPDIVAADSWSKFLSSKCEVRGTRPSRPAKEAVDISSSAGPGGFTFSTSHPGNAFEMQMQISLEVPVEGEVC